MKIRIPLVVAVSLVCLNVAMANGPTPAPGGPAVIILPPLKTSVKFTAVSKIVDGKQTKTFDRLFFCPLPGAETTRRLIYTVRAPINSWHCDEDCSKPFLNGTFVATILVSRREKPLPKRGCFTGTWRILNAAGVQVANGAMAGTVRSGSHDLIFGKPNADCESCAEPCHFEGCLEGRAYSPANPRLQIPGCRGPLCITIQGFGLDPDCLIAGTQEESPAFGMRAEGVIQVPCK